MNKKTSIEHKKLIDNLLSGKVAEKYQGKQVVVIGGKVFILPENDQKAAALVENLEKKHPG